MSNRANVFSLVRSATVSSDSCNSSATFFTTSMRKAGSFRFPRYGEGDKYGASVSNKSIVDGTIRIISDNADFLKVTIPLTPILNRCMRFISSNSSTVPEKQ